MKYIQPKGGGPKRWMQGNRGVVLPTPVSGGTAPKHLSRMKGGPEVLARRAALNAQGQPAGVTPKPRSFWSRLFGG